MYPALIINTRRHLPWPPTPQDILDNEPNINNDLYNGLCLIIHPDARLNDNGRVNLAPSKASKVSQICQDLQALLFNAQPSLKLSSLRTNGLYGPRSSIQIFPQM